MVSAPSRIFNEPLVLTSGTGFDSFGELTISGSTPVSGTGYVKTTHQYAITNGAIESFNLIEAFTDPTQLTPEVGDQLLADTKTYRVTQVRPVIDQDGFHVLDISQLKEVEI